MTNSRNHTPRTVCKALSQLNYLTRSLHNNSELSDDDKKLIYTMMNVSHKAMRKIIDRHNLDINNDFRPAKSKH